MTEPERRVLRALIDEARRARLQPECPYCGKEFEPHPRAHGTQRFCSPAHRRAYWYKHTPQGRVSLILKKRRKRRRVGMARRETHEVTLP